MELKTQKRNPDDITESIDTETLFADTLCEISLSHFSAGAERESIWSLLVGLKTTRGN